MPNKILRRPKVAQPVITRRFTSWSFSRLRDYDPTRGGCPRYAAWKHLAKMATADTPATARGTLVHKDAELFIQGKAKKVSFELQNVAPVLRELRALKRNVQLEAQWGFDSSWNPVAWDDWNRCWLRVKMDAHHLAPKGYTLEMIDWKTGRPKPEFDKEQLRLYGVSGLRRYDGVKAAHGVLHYTDAGVKEELTVKRSSEKQLMKYWEKAVTPMLRDQRFSPAPGPRCKWCDFSKEKGGACEF